jgi:hypothetical protein
MTDDEYAALVALVDTYGLTNVLQQLVEIAREKAVLAREGIETGAGANIWDADAEAIEATSLLILSDAK